jgi:hypothetical protein
MDDYPTGDTYATSGSCWYNTSNSAYYSHGDRLCSWKRGKLLKDCKKSTNKCPSNYIEETDDGKGRARTIWEI